MIAPALQALTTHRQFITYRIVSKADGKTDKLPTDYRTGKVVSAHDPRYWTDFATARESCEQVGFVFTDGDPFFFLDIDNCLEGNQWSQLAQQLCTALAGCAVEVSQSGKGLHLFGTGVLPAHVCKNESLGLELYHTGRFVALTGIGAIGSCAFDASAILPSIVATYFPPDAATLTPSSWTESPCAEWRGPVNDPDLISRAMQSRSASAAFGEKASFADLWLGNGAALGRAFPDPVRAYDANRADSALAQHLSFWTGKDCERIRRLMLASGLVRDKYEREDYLPRTILAVTARQSEVLRDKPGASSSPTVTRVEMSLLQLGTQDSVAQIFASKMSGKMLYDHARSKWLEWDGTRWRIESTQKALNFARDLARSVNYEGKSSLGSAVFCKGVEQLAKADPILSASGTEFDSDNYLLNMPSGTLDLRSGVLHEHNPNDRITLCTTVAPSKANGEAFEKFLAEITQNDLNLAEYLQISLGACLSGAVEAHYMLFWIGRGRNGKNTLGDLVQDAMGGYARKVPASTLVAKAQEGHPTEVANLQGVRLAISSEINDGEHWNEARINEVTGDATLSARFMRCDLFTFRRTHKHLVYGNHRPQLRTVSEGIQARIKIVPFTASFLGREDADLPRRLRENLPYVLNWLIDGHGKWLRADKVLPACRAVEAESTDYFAAQSTPEMWLNERVNILGPDLRPASQCPKSSDLYADYSTWKRLRGEIPVSQTRWAEPMQRKFKKEVSNGVRYRGLVLLPYGGTVPFPNRPDTQPVSEN